MTPQEVLEVSRKGVEAGCTEALFTLGDKPELRWPQAREELAKLGYSSTLDYVADMARLVLRETELLPHINAGVMSRDDILKLRKVSVSQGLMLESISDRLFLSPGGPHFECPDKNPKARLDTIEAAGKEKVPFTTGILIGIGETREERIDSLFALFRMHEKYGHIQEIIIQNFRAKKNTKMENSVEPSFEEIQWTVSIARIIFGEKMSIQVPPNLTPRSSREDLREWRALIDSGISDWGGVSPVTKDWVNPEAPWPQISLLSEATGGGGKRLIPRLALYPFYVKQAVQWLDPSVIPFVVRKSDSFGFSRSQMWAPGMSLPLPPFQNLSTPFFDTQNSNTQNPKTPKKNTQIEKTQLKNSHIEKIQIEKTQKKDTQMRNAQIGDTHFFKSQKSVFISEREGRELSLGFWEERVVERVPRGGFVERVEVGGNGMLVTAGGRGEEDKIPVSREVEEILEIVEKGGILEENQIVRLFRCRGSDFLAVCGTADRIRQKVNGDNVTYVVNRNINYTNICSYGCRFCAFSKGKANEELRGASYRLPLEEISRRVEEAWERGATEVCMQGGIHPEYTGASYLEILRAAKKAARKIHVHAFSPLEVHQGAKTLGISLKSFLEELKKEGLGSLPGTAAEVLDDEVRRELCPDKLNTEEWLEVIETAHSVGLKTSSTIMFGHLDCPKHWARHLLLLRSLQERTGGITEFVPLPFVHMQAPIYLSGGSRRGPTAREAALMHSVGRLVLHPLITNIQASWVKMGPGGAQSLLSLGCNDMGGSLMNESITRAAGARHGEELSPKEMEDLIFSVGRIPVQRTTVYGNPLKSQIERSFLAPSLSPIGKK